MSEKRNVWFGFVGSFSPRFYKEIVHQSFGRSFGYLVLLVLVMSLVLSVKYSFDARAGIQKGAEWVNANLAEKLSEVLPEVTIKDGKLSSPVQQPLVREWEDFDDDLGMGKFAFILDTTGAITSLDGYPNGILITEGKMVVKYKEAGRSKIEEMEFSDIKSFRMTPGEEEGVLIDFNFEGEDFKLTEDIIGKWAGIIGKLLFPVIMVGVFIYYLAAKLLQVLLFSLLSLIVNSANNAKLKYDNLLNIGVFAVTPAVTLAVLTALLNIKIPMFAIIYIGLYSAFLITAIVQIKTANINNVVEK